MQHLRLQPEVVTEQFEPPPQALRAAVVAERPRAQHLEHGQVRAVADLIQVGRAQAALDPGQPAAERMRLALEIRRQRVHARGRVQHRVARAWQQRAPLDLPMTAAAEELDERRDCLVRVHGRKRLSVSGRRKPRRGRSHHSESQSKRRRAVPGRQQVVRSGSGNRRARSSRGRDDDAWATEPHDDHCTGRPQPIKAGNGAARASPARPPPRARARRNPE